MHKAEKKRMWGDGWYAPIPRAGCRDATVLRMCDDDDDDAVLRIVVTTDQTTMLI